MQSPEPVSLKDSIGKISTIWIEISVVANRNLGPDCWYFTNPIIRGTLPRISIRRRPEQFCHPGWGFKPPQVILLLQVTLLKSNDKPVNMGMLCSNKVLYSKTWAHKTQAGSTMHQCNPQVTEQRNTSHGHQQSANTRFCSELHWIILKYK